MMKKYLLLLAIFISLSTINIQAQSFEITHLENHPWGDVNTMLEGHAYVKNISSSAVDIKVKRIEVDVVAGTDNYFCWDVCYTPPVSDAQSPLTAQPGDTLENFYADYLPNGNPGVSKIKYCFYNVNNESDSTCVIIYFSSSPTSIASLSQADINKITNAAPNPASGQTQIHYSVKQQARDARIVLHNMLGAVIKEVPLTEKDGTLKLHLNELNSGVYFYSLVVDKETISTKKLVVSK